MSDSTRAVILLILIMILLLALAFYGSTFLMRRALKAVVKRFRDNDALTPATARTVEELGLARRGMFQFKALRDYKPAALDVLMRNNVIQVTEDNRIFLSEEELAKINFGQKRQY
jgi:hypothetical protein